MLYSLLPSCFLICLTESLIQNFPRAINQLLPFVSPKSDHLFLMEDHQLQILKRGHTCILQKGSNQHANEWGQRKSRFGKTCPWCQLGISSPGGWECVLCHNSAGLPREAYDMGTATYLSPWQLDCRGNWNHLGTSNPSWRLWHSNNKFREADLHWEAINTLMVAKLPRQLNHLGTAVANRTLWVCGLFNVNTQC